MSYPSCPESAARNMEGMSVAVQRVLRNHLKTLHVFPQLTIKPKNDILGSLDKEEIYIGPNQLFLCESVPTCVRFQVVTISCGVTFATEETCKFLRLNKHAFVGCHLVLGRIPNILFPKLELLFNDGFDKCSRIVLPWTYDGPEWDRELLGYELNNYVQLFDQLPVLLCDELENNTVYLQEMLDWIGFGIANNFPRRLFSKTLIHYMRDICDRVHEWCVNCNYNKVDFAIHYQSAFRNCSFDLVKKGNSADAPRGGCPGDCAQRIMTDVCYYPNQYEMTNFWHSECLFTPQIL